MPTAASLATSLTERFADHLSTVCTRATRALSACAYDGLLMHSGSPITIFEDDQTHPFKVNAPFKVWTPLCAPDSFVYYEPGRRPLLLVHAPPDFWHKPLEVPPSWWTDHFEIRLLASRDEARRALPADLSRIAYLGDTFPGLGDWAPAAVNPRRLMRHLDFERAIKTPYELLCLREASRRGATAHQAALQAFAAGASELAIELAFLAAAGQREQDLPYSPIIALNEGGATLHYQLLDPVAPAQSRSLLIDAGVQFAGYASDITRTHTHRERHPEFAALVGLMDRAQQSLCREVRAGVDWQGVHLRSHELVGEVLREAGLIRCTPAEAVDTGVTRVFLPHGIGHLLGLEVHDVGGFMAGPDEGDLPPPPDHPFLRLTRVLQSGFVVTMEPGLYFIDSLLKEARGDGRGAAIHWPTVDRLRPFGGIRIEDNLCITAEGCENLTREAFGKG